MVRLLPSICRRIVEILGGFTMVRRQTRYSAPSSGRSAAGSRLVRWLAALSICVGGALITGLAPTATPAGTSNPSPLLYEIDSGTNAINVFPTTASGNVAPAVIVTANTGRPPERSRRGGVRREGRPLGGQLFGANNIFEYTPSQLAASGSPSPAVVISDAARTQCSHLRRGRRPVGHQLGRWRRGVHGRPADLFGKPHPGGHSRGRRQRLVRAHLRRSRRLVGREL